MKLDKEPSGDVTVTVAGMSGDVTVTGSPLTFTTANYWITKPGAGRTRVRGGEPRGNADHLSACARIPVTPCVTTAESTMAPPARVSRAGTSPTPIHTQMGASTVSTNESSATSAAGR